MNYFTSLILVAALFGATLQSPAVAGDKKFVKGAQKLGEAVVWPIKKLGQGVKAAGTSTKNALSRKK